MPPNPSGSCQGAIVAVGDWLDRARCVRLSYVPPGVRAQQA